MIDVGAACPDHLVHTKRLPMWVPYDPRPTRIDELAERIVAGAQPTATEYERYFTTTRAASDSMPTLIHAWY